MDVSEKIRNGDYKTNPTMIPVGATKEERRAIRLANSHLEGDMTAKFRADLEAEEGTARLPENVRDRVWSLAWEEGHAYGYSEVYNCYSDYGDLAELAYEAGIKSTR